MPSLPRSRVSTFLSFQPFMFFFSFADFCGLLSQMAHGSLRCSFCSLFKEVLLRFSPGSGIPFLSPFVPGEIHPLEFSMNVPLRLIEWLPILPLLYRPATLFFLPLSAFKVRDSPELVDRAMTAPSFLHRLAAFLRYRPEGVLPSFLPLVDLPPFEARLLFCR